MPLQPLDVMSIVGKRGSGKSHFFRTHVEPGERRIFTWDPHREHPCARRVTVDELPGLLEELVAGEFRIGVTPSSRWPDKAGEEFEKFAQWMEGAPLGGYTLAVDEVGILNENAARALNFVATQSRHFGEEAGFPGVPLVFIAQRAVQIPKTAREQSSHVVSFRQDNDADVEALRERIGPMADRVSRLNRKRHEFVHWREDEQT